MFSSLRKITALPLWIASVGTMGISLLAVLAKHLQVISQSSEQQQQFLHMIFFTDTERLINSVSAIISSSRADAFWFLDRFTMLIDYYPFHMLIIGMLLYILGNKISGSSLLSVIGEIIALPFKLFAKFVMTGFGTFCILVFIGILSYGYSPWCLILYIFVPLLRDLCDPNVVNFTPYRAVSASTNRAVERSNEDLERAQRELDRAHSATAAERKRLEESLAKAQREAKAQQEKAEKEARAARAADSARGNTVSYNASMKNCGTCDNWCGSRSVDVSRRYAQFRVNDKGECAGGAFNRQNMAALATCPKYTTWNKIR